MKVRRSACFLLLPAVIISVLFSSCGGEAEGETTEPDSNAVSFGINEEESSEKKSSASINFHEPIFESNSSESTTEPPLDDVIQSMEGIPFVGIAIFSEFDDPNSWFQQIIYDGSDFEFYLQAGSSSNVMDFGIAFTLDGVFQDIKVEYDGKVTDYSTLHVVQIPAGSSKIFKIYLRPNIGKKGDVLQFRNSSVSNATSLITEDNKNYVLDDCSIVTTLPTDFVMNADSTSSVSVCSDFSGANIGPYNIKIRDHFEELSNGMNDMCRIWIYNDLDKSLYTDDDGLGFYSPKVYADSAKNVPLTIALGKKPGTTQRVSLYINNKAQPVFDGKYYADVKIEDNKQTTLNVSIDTTKLDTWNNMYLVAATLNDNPKDGIGFAQSNVYVLKVNK